MGYNLLLTSENFYLIKVKLHLNEHNKWFFAHNMHIISYIMLINIIYTKKKWTMHLICNK